VHAPHGFRVARLFFAKLHARSVGPWPGHEHLVFAGRECRT
jgi:hypothetical protein